MKSDMKWNWQIILALVGIWTTVIIGGFQIIAGERQERQDIEKAMENIQAQVNGLIAVSSAPTGPAPSQPPPTPDFGNDTSAWAMDGECDDPRFAGDEMPLILLDADSGHDATDCRALYDAGRIQLR